MKLIKIIKELLLKAVDDIDAGNSNITEDDAEDIIEALLKYTRKDEGLSKYLAIEYLNNKGCRVCRSTFDNYIREGRLTEGRKILGFKEKRFFKRDLDKFLAMRVSL